MCRHILHQLSDDLLLKRLSHINFSLYRFLRGGIEADVLNFEEDTLQQHVHDHSVTDPGHGHRYYDIHHVWNTSEGKGLWGQADHNTADIDNRNTDSEKTGITITIDQVYGARTSTETRPKNMRVVYIMKVC